MENYQELESQIFTEHRMPNYATFWERVGASIIDSIIIGIPGFILNRLFGLNFGSLLIGWLYSALFESSASGATLGKRALNIRVTNLNGGQISFLQATGRHFGKIVSAMILFIGFLMVLWDDKKQGLHDKMANTLVVKS